MLITISGLPGCGSSTVAGLVAEAVGIERVDGGSLFRGMAAERGLDLAEFSRVAEADPEIDLQLDQWLADRAKEGGVLLESRLAGWLVTKEGLPATRVWIDAREDERARRVAARDGMDIGRALAENRAREASERRRYRTNYGVDLDDRSFYDFVVDSTRIQPEVIAASIIRKAGK